MKVLVLWLLLFSALQNIAAQDKKEAEEKRFVVKAGSSIREVLPITDLYRYPHFLNGKVFYKGGNTASGKLNYNLLVGEMQFINPVGDTLAVDNEKTIQLVIIKEDTFLYDNGFLEAVSISQPVKCAKQYALKIVNKAKMGGYGLSEPNAAIDAYSYYMGDNTFYKL